jgi:hypothetical protein
VAPVRVDVPGAEIAGQDRSRRLRVHRSDPGLDQPEDHPDRHRSVAADHDRALGPVPAPPVEERGVDDRPGRDELAQQLLGHLARTTPLHRPLQQRRGRDRLDQLVQHRGERGLQPVHGQRDGRIEPEQPTVGAQREHRPVRRQPEHRGQAGDERGRRWFGRHASMVTESGGPRREPSTGGSACGQPWGAAPASSAGPRLGRWRTPRSSKYGAVLVGGAWSALVVRATP